MRHQIFLLAGGAHVVALLAFGCSFPDYVVRPTPSDGGGGASSMSPQGGGGSEAVAGSSGGAAGLGEVAGGALNAGASGAGTGGNEGGGAGQGGASGAGEEGGEGGCPFAVPKKCADFLALPPDATCFDDANHAYLFRSETKSFAIAAAQCAFYEMHLASIGSHVEDAFVIQSAAKISGPSRFGYFWIGASTIGSPGAWHWADGSVFWTGGAHGTPNGNAYFNWRSDSPMNVSSDSCAFSDEAGWQDGDCTLNRPYVCEAN